jgi:DNA polymerase III epsilon subunit-like protein
VFLDCETSGVHNGREPACRCYVNACIERVVKEAEGAGRDAGAAKLACIDGILRGVLEGVLANQALEAGDTTRLEASFNRIVQDFIPTANAHNAHLKRFVYMPFDEAFGQFWRQTEHIRLLSTDKAHRELYRDAFTKQALRELSKTMPWTFLRGGDGALHLCYDEAAGAEGVELLAFDAEEKAHVDAVARACFGPAVLSICMLEAEVRGGGLVVGQEPYYQVFRQHGRYVHSPHAETAHKLTEAEVQGGADIASLHAKLRELVDAEGAGGGLTFVAHNAVRDRQWLAQSIQEQIRYLAYMDCKSGKTEAGAEIAGLHALLDRLGGSQWFCTQHGDLDAAGHARSRNCALAKIMENRGDGLRGVYEKVTGRALQGQHDARVDTYACALIFCRLLLLNHGVDVETSGGYAKLQAMLAEVQDACQGGRVVRKTEGSSMEALLTRIMKLLHEA